MVILWAAALCLMATSVQAERPTSLTGLGEAALADRFPERAVWLALEDESRALGLFQPETKTPAKAVLLVLADEGQSAAQSLQGELLSALAERRVAVMSLGVPAPPESLRQRRAQRPKAESAEGAEDDANPESAQTGSVMIDLAADDDPGQAAANHRDRILATLNAAAAELQARGYEGIAVAGMGWSAGYATDWALAQGDTAGLIWIAGRFPGGQSGALAEQLAGARDWGVLDLQDRQADGSSVDRASAMARAEVPRYQWQAVPVDSWAEPVSADRLASRISAWISP
ncbi:MAG: DUF3530 family protein [Pseudomonadota bacterium]|nr:DUF3530 family protein [Pseudomonadota bacterium]